jgi:hypothetical protein
MTKKVTGYIVEIPLKFRIPLCQLLFAYKLARCAKALYL